ncbi:PREDICTED: DNA polymerase nu-like isoform X2 [Papilio polytes]|uniref:DNA polymerase nu-like isoform X2 n=1 Tax=Papilio polytes TaxID=76194 RepID=UPI0006764000|nr:PREDICTED: DNA polymerase nu-like isoform X2 [Papilio polytes]
MNFNNLHEIAGRKYEKYLSTFGRKVLKVLIQQNTKDDLASNRNNFNIGNTRPYSNTETANFRYSDLNHIPPSNSEKIVIDFANDNLSNDHTVSSLQNGVDLVTNTMPCENPVVPTSNELVKCVYEDVNPQIAHQNMHSNSLNNDITPVPPASSLLNIVNDEVRQESKTLDHADEVPWEDMFDTELLSDVNNTEKDTCENYVKATKLSEPEFLNKPVENNNSKTRGSKTSKKRVKKHPADIEDLLPKKIKKNPKDSKVVKSSFRKQKYSKSVKTWLNDVDPSNPVEPEVPSENLHANETGTISKENSLKTPDTNIEQSKYKRTVQAQLSNQNGIMKYCKPKILSEVNNVEKQGSTTDANKERIVKPKFIPPIKSQIPVKELTYDIATIENESLNVLNLFEYSDEEIAITLIYRNGFCQLNKQHTEDVDIAEGIMILTKDKYYYLTNSSTKYSESLETFLNKNSLVCYEGKHVITHFVNQFGISIDMCNAKFLDVKVGGSLLDPDNPPDNFSQVQKLIGYVAEFTIATECGLQKTAWYLMLLQHCWQRVQQSLLDQGLWKVFMDIEMRVLPIISEMERVGVCVNMEKLKGMERLLVARMQRVEQASHRAAGRVFQLTSAPQVRAILYDELQLDSHCNVKIRETICKGAKSTSETMLRSLMNKHPLPKLILEYRHLHKAHSTFLLGIAQCVRDGVVRPVWEQSAAATGRIACNTPNLQAVPKAPFALSMFPAPFGEEEEALNLRSLYESRAGRLLVSADFRQVECRVLALAAGDAALLAALRGPDLFTLLAATWLGKEEAAVTGEERERTKRVVYASMYGAGANKLADVLGLGYDRALEVTASFNRTFPSLRRFGREVVARCERDGTLRTPCGRARHFKEIASPHAAARAQAERKAINFIIQGCAADVCKTAMVRCAAALAGRARLLLQIHDELVWEVRHEHLHEAAVIQRAMEGCGPACGLQARLPVALRCGPNWGQMEEFTPQTE